MRWTRNSDRWLSESPAPKIGAAVAVKRSGTCQKNGGSTARHSGQVAVDAVKGELTVAQLPPGTRSIPQIQAWKKALLGGAANVFDGKQDKRQKSDDALISRLYQQIGQLKVERDSWRRGPVHEPGERREMVDREHPALSTLRQCALMGISRSSVYYRPRAPSQKDLALMKQIDQQYLAHALLRSRRMKVWLDRQATG